jgi:hypothetical protein
MLRVILALAALAGLAGCTDPTSASPEAISQARYVSGEPPSLTIISMKNVSSGSSEHTGMIINGTQQVLYDPAGNFRYAAAPRAGDGHYGMTPTAIKAYESFHARSDYFLKIQTVPITLETADELIARAQQQGVTRQMFCSVSAGEVISDVAPFQNAPVSMFPTAIEKYFDTVPGVVTSTFYENDFGKN